MSWSGSFEVPGEPMSKARARSGNGHHYTPQATQDAEARVQAAWLASSCRRRTIGDQAFGITVHFAVGTRVRRDVDNMLKLVMDALNKVVWNDDIQVLQVAARKSFVPKKEAHTEILIYELPLPPELVVTAPRKRVALPRR